jgi:uncharacterized protein YjbJ (UPF0337 family)
MNIDILAGKWKQMKGEVKKKWAKLTDDDLAYIEGDKDKMQGKLQERYGYTKEEAKKHVHDMFDNFNDKQS